MGGARVADQALRLGVVDEINLHVYPELPGAGTRLFADRGKERIRLEPTRLTEGPNAPHLQYRVVPAGGAARLTSIDAGLRAEDCIDIE